MRCAASSAGVCWPSCACSLARRAHVSACSASISSARSRWRSASEAWPRPAACEALAVCCASGALSCAASSAAHLGYVHVRLQLGCVGMQPGCVRLQPVAHSVAARTAWRAHFRSKYGGAPALKDARVCRGGRGGEQQQGGGEQAVPPRVEGVGAQQRAECRHRAHLGDVPSGWRWGAVGVALGLH